MLLHIARLQANSQTRVRKRDKDQAGVCMEEALRSLLPGVNFSKSRKRKAAGPTDQEQPAVRTKRAETLAEPSLPSSKASAAEVLGLLHPVCLSKGHYLLNLLTDWVCRWQQCCARPTKSEWLVKNPVHRYG